MNRKEVGKQFAAMLLAMRALKISVLKPFIWTSGWKSPLYCNSRNVLFYPEKRDWVKQMVADLVVEKYGGENIVLVGVATAGIALGVLVADLLELPFACAAPSEEHGTSSYIDLSILSEEHRVVIIDDLISTGKSALAAVEAVRETGATVLGVIALFDYAFPMAMNTLGNAGVRFDSLSDYHILMGLVKEQQLIEPADEEPIENWRLNPAKWMQ